jgi:cyclic-di-AMP phosphodiesterase PgpH
MAIAWRSPPWLLRAVAAVIALVGVPLALSVSAFVQETPIRLGEPSPRTVVAPDLIRVQDEEATERARREAAAAVNPVTTEDDEARTATVAEVRDAFARVQAVRGSGEDEAPQTRTEQIDELAERLPMLTSEGLRLVTGLSDSQLQQVAATSESVTQQLMRGQFTAERLEDVRTRALRSEIAIRSFPQGVGELVVEPIVASALRPTLRVDEEATQAERENAAAAVAPVEQRFSPQTVIVSAGEEVSEVQYQALRARGLEGSEPWRFTLRAFALTLVIVLAVAGYLRAYRPKVWGSLRRVLLLSILFLLFAVALEAVTLLPVAGSIWLFVLPVGALAMLATILFDPPIGVLMTIPMTVLVAFSMPGDPGVVVFAAIASLASVPLVSRLSARGDLRRAAGVSTLVYVALAAICAGVFIGPEAMPLAALVGLGNGVATALIVIGSLPFLESVFGILTATSLLDLADRNHPLLRELEQKALGSYNHSIMVSSMVDRACRAIGADALLGSVMALYHDIGKVRRPYFFVENQFAIPNPHDELEPRVSAVIIQEHVTDGIEMARSYRLPPEVVEGIATHHGTTLVSYFYRQAVTRAGDSDAVDEQHYRYKGRKPSTKETAVLMLADCCEGASRAAALNNRNLSREDLESIVTGLIADRVEDGQLDEASLTFRELRIVEESFIETLVGVYHPRIAYPADPRKDAGTDTGTDAAAVGTPPASDVPSRGASRTDGAARRAVGNGSGGRVRSGAADGAGGGPGGAEAEVRP